MTYKMPFREMRLFRKLITLVTATQLSQEKILTKYIKKTKTNPNTNKLVIVKKNTQKTHKTKSKMCRVLCTTMAKNTAFS